MWSGILNTGKPALWVTASAGQTAGYLRFPMPLAVNPANKNEYVVWDCRADPTELLDLSVEEIARRAFGSKAELKEGESRLSLFKLKVNTSPFVCADLRVAGARVRERFNLDLPTILANGEKLAKVANLLEGPVLEALRIAQASRGIDETEAMERDAATARDVDFSLYEGFVNEADKNLMREVHALSPNAMAERAREGRIHFADPRINELFLRMRARSWPETLSNLRSARRTKRTAARCLKGACRATPASKPILKRSMRGPTTWPRRLKQAASRPKRLRLGKTSSTRFTIGESTWPGASRA